MTNALVMYLRSEARRDPEIQHAGHSRLSDAADALEALLEGRELRPVMTRDEVELELRLHMANLCLSVLSKKAGVMRECKELLIDKVCELLVQVDKARAPS